MDYYEASQGQHMPTKATKKYVCFRLPDLPCSKPANPEQKQQKTKKKKIYWQIQQKYTFDNTHLCATA